MTDYMFMIFDTISEYSSSIYTNSKAFWKVLFDKVYNFGSPSDTTDRLYPIVSKYNQSLMFFSDPVRIIDNIYLGSAFNANKFKQLTDLGITHIINVTKEISNYYPNDFKYTKYEINDDNSGAPAVDTKSPVAGDTIDKDTFKKFSDDDLNKSLFDLKTTISDDLKIMIDVTRIIKESPKDKIFIHCFMGGSRSVSVILYYLITEKKMKLDDAITLIRNKRPFINPNNRFIKILKGLEN